VTTGATMVLLVLAVGARTQEATPDAAALRARYAEAQKRHAGGEVVPARAIMKEILDADPRNFEIAFSIARWLCMDRGDFVGGEPFARRAAELHPDSADAVNVLGACLNSTGRSDEAEVVYRTGVERFASESAMHYGLGMACAQQKKYLEALSAFSKAIELGPTSGLYRFSKGECHLNLREWESAERELRLAVQLKGHDDAQWRLGEVLARQGKDAEAEKTLQLALNEGSKLTRWSAALQLGIFFFEHGRHDDAAAILHQATKHRPEGRDAWMWLARAERALGHEAASTRALKKYRELRAIDDREEEERLLARIQAQLEGGRAPPSDEKPRPPDHE